MYSSDDRDDGRLTYYRTAERPNLELWILDDDDNLIDFSTGYAFEFKLAAGVGAGATFTATFTKTTGITGAVGSGSELAGTPNVTVSFTAGELAPVVAGIYTWQLRATTGGLDRIYQGQFDLLEVVT